MIAAALRNSTRALLAGRNPIAPRLPTPSIDVNPKKCLPKLNLTRSLVSAPPARRIPLASKLGFFAFFFLFLLVPELAMVAAIPNHAGTSIDAIRRKQEEEEAREAEENEE